MKSVFKNCLSKITTIIRPKKVLLIFVGDLVLESLNEKYDKWRKECDMLFIHTDMSQSIMYQRFKKLEHLYIGDDDFRNTCGKREFEEGRSYVEKNFDKIFNKVRKYKKGKILLISTLRYSSACGITASIFSELCMTGFQVSIIGVKPFKFEGIRAVHNFSKAMEVMRRNCQNNIEIIETEIDSKEYIIISFIINKIIETIDTKIK